MTRLAASATKTVPFVSPSSGPVCPVRASDEADESGEAGEEGEASVRSLTVMERSR
jgi:hypothetical protein